MTMMTPVGATEPRQMPVAIAATATSIPATGNWIYKDSLSCVYQLISAAAATVIIEGTNDQATAQGNANNACPVTGNIGSSTIALGAAGSVCLIEQCPTAWRWVRARITVASDVTSVLMGV